MALTLSTQELAKARQQAIDAGYTPQQIDAFEASQKISSPNKGLLYNAFVQPAETYGRFVGEGIASAGKMLTGQVGVFGGKSKYEKELNQINTQLFELGKRKDINSPEVQAQAQSLMKRQDELTGSMQKAAGPAVMDPLAWQRMQVGGNKAIALETAGAVASGIDAATTYFGLAGLGKGLVKAGAKAVGKEIGKETIKTLATQEAKGLIPQIAGAMTSKYGKLPGIAKNLISVAGPGAISAAGMPSTALSTEQNAKDMMNRALYGAVGSELFYGLGKGAELGIKYGTKKLTQELPESMMGSLFKESKTMVKSKMGGKGESIGKQALERKFTAKTVEDLIQKTDVASAKVHEDLNKVLAKSNQVIDMSKYTNNLLQLADDAGRSGNTELQNAIINRLDAIEKYNGRFVTLSQLNNIKKALYEDIGNAAYGKEASVGKEVLKEIASTFKTAIEENADTLLGKGSGTQVKALNQTYGFYRAAQDAAKEAEYAAASGNKGAGFLSNLKQGIFPVITGGVGMVGGGVTGGVMGATAGAAAQAAVSTPAFKTGASNLLYQAGKTIAGSGIQDVTLTPALARLGARGAAGAYQAGVSPQLTEALSTSEISPTTGRPLSETQKQPTPEGTQDLTGTTDIGYGISMPKYLSLQNIQEDVLYDRMNNKSRGKDYIKTVLQQAAVSQNDYAAIDNIDKFVDLLYGTVPKEVKTTTQEKATKATMDKAKLAYEYYLKNKDTIRTGPVSGPYEITTGGIGMKRDPETLRFDTLLSNIEAEITKARAGATLSKNERELLGRYVPNIKDTSQIVEEKLLQLQNNPEIFQSVVSNLISPYTGSTQ